MKKVYFLWIMLLTGCSSTNDIFSLFSFATDVIIAIIKPSSGKSNGHWQLIRGNGLEEIPFVTDNKFEGLIFWHRDTGIIGGTFYPYRIGDPFDRKIHGVTYWRTEDGGRNWTRHLLLPGGTFRGFYRAGAHYYMRVSEKKDGDSTLIFYLSTDRGKTWREKFRRKNSEWAYSFLGFTDTLRGYMRGEKGMLLETNDGGENWTEHHLPYRSPYIIGINDSLVYYTRSKQEKIYFNCWNFRKKRHLFQLPLPHFGDFDIKYTDNLLVIHPQKPKDTPPHFYEVTSDYQLKHISTPERPVFRIEYIAKDKNKIYMQYSYSLNHLLIYSDDGGKTWQERKTLGFTLLGDPIFALPDRDTFRIWIKHYDNELTTFRN